MKKIIGIVFSLVLVLMFLVCSMSCLPAYAVAETTETELHENDISATTEESVRPALPLRSTTEKTEEDETESTDAGTSEAEQGTTEANIEADQEGLVEPETSTVNETDAAGETEPFNLRQKLNKKTMVIIAAAVASVLVTAIVCIARGKSAQSTARGTDAEIDPREDHKTTANSTEKDLPMYMTSITYEPDKSGACA